MANEESPVEAQIKEKALASQAHGSTYRLVDLTDGSRGGTVVAVNIGNRFFLATAKHVIPESHRFQVVLRNETTGPTDFVAHHVHPTLDVGLLEVAQKDVPVFGDTFVPANRIQPLANQDGNYDVTVIGYPAKLGRLVDRHPISRAEMLERYEWSALTFHSFALPPPEWPPASECLPPVPVPGIDIFVSYYDQEETMHLLHPKTAGIIPPAIHGSPPPPRGISGGGIWLLNSRDLNEVWRPTALLHAIQSGLCKPAWLRGVLIGAWLQIVDDHYPDVRAELQSIRDSAKVPQAP